MMRSHDIFEAPIENWTIDPEFDANEKEMISKFTGYERDIKHWSDIDKAAIKSPAVVKRIRTAFLKTTHVFDLYFWQSNIPNYDKTLEKGKRSSEWIAKTLGPVAAKSINPRPGVITVVMTNNLSDDHKISMMSPWMVAHRIAHSIIGGGRKEGSGWVALELFDELARRICKVAYGVPWPDQHRSSLDMIMHEEHLDDYLPILGHMLGTMKSARDGHLVRGAEWKYETLVQYMLTGRIAFRPLQPALDSYYKLTTDPKKLALAEKIQATFLKKIKKAFDDVLTDAAGSIWVM